MMDVRSILRQSDSAGPGGLWHKRAARRRRLSGHSKGRTRPKRLAAARKARRRMESESRRRNRAM